MACGHVFHKSCISTAIYFNNKCPLCRFPIEVDPLAAQQEEIFEIANAAAPFDEDEEAIDAALAQFDNQHLAGFVVSDGVVEEGEANAEDAALEAALAQLAANHGETAAAGWDFDESDTDTDDYEPPPANAPLRRSTRSIRFTGTSFVTEYHFDGSDTSSYDDGDRESDSDYVPGESEYDDSN